ncbi:hypothetical protein WDW86_05975 [Bdellovibrionota bacterium FG-2]
MSVTFGANVDAVAGADKVIARVQIVDVLICILSIDFERTTLWRIEQQAASDLVVQSHFYLYK